MARSFPTTLLTVCTLLLAFRLVSCKSKRQTDDDPVDSFKSLENFPYATALYDIDMDGDLDCLNAVRTEYETDPPSATYILSLKDKQGDTVLNYTYLLLPGPAPDRQVVIIDNDYDHPLRNHYIYSDYENCVLMKFPLQNHVACVLWVSNEIKDGVPQNCVDHFEDSCNGAPTYDKDSCEGLIR